jgi:hypothetical protein
MEENGLALEDVLAVGWRPPGVGNEIRKLAPTPRNEEIVSFIAFYCLGLGLPLHPFVQGLLFFYGL